MAKSYVKKIDGTVRLFINDKQVPSCAYTTYFDERNHYEAFTKAGYDLYSVTFAFASRSLNSTTAFTPYEKGIFDKENEPDFSIVDEAVAKVLRVNPNAYIFPRVFMAMPEWWCEQNPEEIIIAPCGEKREMLFSDAFRKQGDIFLKALIDHVKNSSYAENIIGYHLADGDTEEWFHHCRQGGVCENAKKYFFRFLDEKYPDEDLPRELPDMKKLCVEGKIEDKLLTRYLEFSNTAVADSIAHFAKTVKEVTNFEQTVGTFYGYITEICSPLPGDVALHQIIDCPYIDFFCSPNSYVKTRALGIDWGDSLPFASLREHGKIYFSECDIRTSLSDYINNCRPGADKTNSYYGDIWRGPKTVKGSVAAMRKAFAHQITRGNSLWWFDMWGGWYDHPRYMSEAKRCRRLFEKHDYMQYSVKTDIAVFVDGKLYQYQGMSHRSARSQCDIRNSLGNSGLAFDLYLLDDFKARYKDYKAIILPTAVSSPELEEAKALCKQAGIPMLCSSMEKWEFTPKELREFAKSAKAHVFCESDDVILFGNSLLAIHTASSGKKEIKLPKKALIKNVCSNAKPFVSDKIVLDMKKHETLIFTLKNT